MVATTSTFYFVQQIIAEVTHVTLFNFLDDRLKHLSLGQTDASER